jgi:hypothetical protein
VLSYVYYRRRCLYPTHIPTDTVPNSDSLCSHIILSMTGKVASSRCISNFAELGRLTAGLQSYTVIFVAFQTECASIEMRNKSYNGQSQMGVR